MVTRRAFVGGLATLLATPAAAVARGRGPARELDAIIDISHSSTVNDFRLARRHSKILGVIHKASEGGDWADPLYAKRRAEAEAAGLLWGAYHFGTRQYSGEAQALMFLATAKPGRATLLALDLEFNELNPANSMRIKQAEDFVRTIVAKTGKRPLIYTTASWADNEPVGPRQHRLGGRISEDSILANCPLWVADYRPKGPQLPIAWRGRGWHFWQYAGDAEDGGHRASRTRGVAGIESCDRNFFRGDETMLRKFWTAAGGPAKSRRA